MPVVGGYLGYIGWFCFAAGLGIVTGEPINDPSTLYRLFHLAYIPKLFVLALLTGVLLSINLLIKNNPFVLPGVLLVLPF